ncbi:MAG: hypothetical protein J5552_09485 [Prevotella sp.]|nr:hypothetical protein [Prevotella sp.]
MKKPLFFALAACFGLFLASCSDSKKQRGGEAAAEVVETTTQEVDDPEAAVKAYEDYFAKYDDLQKRSEAGEDVIDDIMELQEEVWPITNQLMKTEQLRNDEQNARVKDIDEKIDAWKKKLLGE